MAELKPCPFCGDEDISMRTSLEGCEIMCPSCGATIFRAPLRTCKTIAEVREAVANQTEAAWNRRVPQTEVHQYGENCTHIFNCGTLNLNL